MEVATGWAVCGYDQRLEVFGSERMIAISKPWD
jgi:hypothetical protein